MSVFRLPKRLCNEISLIMQGFGGAISKMTERHNREAGRIWGHLNKQVIWDLGAWIVLTQPCQPNNA